MKNLILKLKVMRDTRGQDLIEYALMAGFVAVAAGAIMPGVADSISTIFSKVASLLGVRHRVRLSSGRPHAKVECESLKWVGESMAGRPAGEPAGPGEQRLIHRKICGE